jgi:hypothetical protein
MTLFDPELKIAAGHNNVAGLVSIESITATGDSRPYSIPTAWFNYVPGQFKVRTDQTIYIRGKPSTAWVFTYMTKNQLVYLQDTYCAGSYDGNVTIRTRLRDNGAYLNMNARMLVPFNAQTTNRLGKLDKPVRVSFTNLELI